MTELKPYHKDKEGKLQRLPVEHKPIQVHNEEELLTPKPKTRVIIHHGKLDQVPLQMVKSAQMGTNPFIALMRRAAKATEERDKMRENAAKND